jgi:hypothetical protein
MSGAERPPDPPVPTTGLKRKQLSDQDQDDLGQLDGIFKRIKTAVPRAPYILSTPSLNPYRYHSAQEARAWMLGHLFTHDEEYLQYRTYLFREPYRDCFTLQPGEDDEPETPLPKSQSSDVASARPKKKISLADYKNKQANGVSAPGSKKASPTLQPTKPNVSRPNGVKPPHAQAPAHEQEKDGSAQSKRYVSRASCSTCTDICRPEKKMSEKPNKRDAADPPAPSSQKSESAESKINIDKSGPSNSTPHGLPPLLSPVEQPLSNPHGLPTILSPTLPPNIQVELDKIETRQRADSNTSTSSSDRNKGQTLHVPERTASKRPVATKDGEASQSVSRELHRPTSPSIKVMILNRASLPSSSSRRKHGRTSRDCLLSRQKEKPLLLGRSVMSSHPSRPRKARSQTASRRNRSRYPKSQHAALSRPQLRPRLPCHQSRLLKSAHERKMIRPKHHQYQRNVRGHPQYPHSRTALSPHETKSPRPQLLHTN